MHCCCTRHVCITVFYDASSQKSWGRYLEASPSSREDVGLTWKRLSVNDRVNRMYYDTRSSTARQKRVASKLIGAGQLNTTRLIRTYGRGNCAARYAASRVVNGFDDWFLPSEDEIEKTYTFMQAADTPIDTLKRFRALPLRRFVPEPSAHLADAQPREGDKVRAPKYSGV